MIQIGFQSDKGLVREHNEDSYFVVPADNICIVADGVGGNNAGDFASRTAVQVVAAYIKENDISECKTDEEISEYFRKAIQIANDVICRYAEMSPEKTGMATTMVLAYIRDRFAYFVNIGDSRAYIDHKDVLVQITKDHTYVNKLVQIGTISPEDAKNHSQRNVITRALGISEIANPDYYKSEIFEGDLIILCSDGLYEDVTEAEMIDIIGSTDEGEGVSAVCNRLVERANENGGHDNVTVVCLKI